MYEMYPASWRVADEPEYPVRRPTESEPRSDAVQEAINRRDNGGEPIQ